MNRACMGVGRGRATQIVGCVTVALVSCWGGRAQAERTADDKALATVLFQEGRTLMAEGRIGEACTKLEESQRLDPSGGTLLNLALCHEQEGRLARAWSEFNDALVLARRDSRRDRENAAGEHIGALAPRLSKLTVVVPVGAQVEGLRIECDGRELGRGAWATAMPIDGGEHVVRAMAPGKLPFATTVVMGKEADAQTIEVPVLTDSPAVAVARQIEASPSASAVLVTAPATGVAKDRGPGIRRTLAYTLGGAALVQLGVAGYFGWRAFDKKRTSDAECPGPRCTAKGSTLADEAWADANVSTILATTGIVTAAAGVYLLVTSRHKAVPPTESKLTLHISGRGLTVGGRF